MDGDILLAFLTVSGLALWACRLYGRLLRPASPAGCWTVVAGRGGGEELEQRVRALVWQRSLGLGEGVLIIADLNLTPEGRALAEHLSARYPQVVVKPAEELPAYIGQNF